MQLVTIILSVYVASQEDVKLSDHTSLLAQGNKSHVDHVTHNYVHCYIAEAQMFELIEIVIPRIRAKWESLAYCMRYTLEEVSGFRKDSQDCGECCKNLFANWISTGHEPKPKTYETLLKHIKKVDKLTVTSEVLAEELIKATEGT